MSARADSNYLGSLLVWVWLVLVCVWLLVVFAFGVLGEDGGDSSWMDRQAREWPRATGEALKECALRRPGEQVMPGSWEVIFECRAGIPRLVSR